MTTKKATAKKIDPKAKKITPADPKPVSQVVDTPPIDKDAEIAKALDDLKAAATSGAKKAIRRRLRSLGHAGGLGLNRKENGA